jgi:hypothetical protein
VTDLDAIVDLLGIPGDDWRINKWDAPFEGNVASLKRTCLCDYSSCYCCDPENLTQQQYDILRRYLPTEATREATP